MKKFTHFLRQGLTSELKGSSAAHRWTDTQPTPCGNRWGFLTFLSSITARGRERGSVLEDIRRAMMILSDDVWCKPESSGDTDTAECAGHVGGRDTDRWNIFGEFNHWKWSFCLQVTRRKEAKLIDCLGRCVSPPSAHLHRSSRILVSL